MQIVIPPFSIEGTFDKGPAKGGRSPAIGTANKHIRSKSNSFPKMQSRAKKTTSIRMWNAEAIDQKSPVPPPPLAQQWKKNKMEKQNVNMPTSNLSVEKFLRLFIYFRTLDFSTIASVSPLRWHLSTTPHFTTSSFDKVLAHTHTIYIYIHI